MKPVVKTDGLMTKPVTKAPQPLSAARRSPRRWPPAHARRRLSSPRRLPALRVYRAGFAAATDRRSALSAPGAARAADRTIPSASKHGARRERERKTEQRKKRAGNERRRHADDEPVRHRLADIRTVGLHREQCRRVRRNEAMDDVRTAPKTQALVARARGAWTTRAMSWRRGGTPGGVRAPAAFRQR